MNNFFRIALVFLSIGLLIAPVMAEAKFGGGASSGSRGSRTYNSVPNARPIERSITPQQPAQRPSYNPAPAYAPQMAPAGGGFFRGLAGGFLGAGLFSMLFGGHAMGMNGEMGGGGGGMGLLPMILIGVVLYFIYKRMRGGMNSGMGGGGMLNPFSGASSSNAPAAATVGVPIDITDNDKRSFEQILINVQTQAGNNDINGLNALVTPEMLQYFKEDISANQSRGVINKIESVKLDYAEILEAWHEYDLDYATARMRWTAIDYMAKAGGRPTDADYVVSGSNVTPTNQEEIWTFVRASGGKWLLSAVQQVA